MSDATTGVESEPMEPEDAGGESRAREPRVGSVPWHAAEARAEAESFDQLAKNEANPHTSGAYELNAEEQRSLALHLERLEMIEQAYRELKDTLWSLDDPETSIAGLCARDKFDARLEELLDPTMRCTYDPLTGEAPE